MSTPRIDNLVPGSIVTLNLRNYQEDVVFLRITGTGEDRHAEFVSTVSSDKNMYRWAAYRFEGRWVYGSSADRLSVVTVKDDGTKPL